MHPPKRGERACGWSWGLLPSQTLISILERSGCARGIATTVAALLPGAPGARSAAECGSIPLSRQHGVLEQRLPGVFP